MPCLFALFTLLAPRILTLVLWFFTSWFEGLFASLLWPILGFLFAPTTLLWYSVVENIYGGAWDPWHLLVGVIAVLIDFSPASGKRND